MYTSPIRLLAFDLDGTVLNDQKQLTPRTLAALTAAAERGVALVPATGRTAAGLPAALLALPGVRYAITSNGARVMDLAAGRARRYSGQYHTAASASPQNTSMTECCLVKTVDTQISPAQP